MSAAAQIGEDAAMRHFCTVNWPALLLSPPASEPVIALTRASVWLPQLPTVAGGIVVGTFGWVGIVEPPPGGIVELVVVVDDEDVDVVVVFRGLSADFEPPPSQAARPIVTSTASAAATTGERDTGNLRGRVQHAAPPTRRRDTPDRFPASTPT